jgi:hypothetical protein
MIFRSNAGLVAIILVEFILAGVLTRFAFDLPTSSQSSNPNPLDVKEPAPDDYIFLVAASFRNDSDIALARERLALFQDEDYAERVGQLALSYASQHKRQANELAALALALGSTDQAVALIAQSDTDTSGKSPPVLSVSSGAAPTMAAIASFTPSRTPTLTRIPFTPTRKPSATSTRTSTALPSATRTFTPTASVTPTLVPSTPTITPAVSATPTPTATFAPSGSVNTTWLPDRTQWPSGAPFQPASVTPGQQYWRLVRALYCDYTEVRFDCPSLPGGPAGTNTYVMLISPAGNRAEAPLLLNGTLSSLEQKTATDMCNCNYSFPDDEWAISIGGAPSDAISGLALFSVKFGLRQYHVRYFLTYHLSTK